MPSSGAKCEATRHWSSLVSRIDAIFFDLDGTLTDPKVGITRCIRYALRELGVTPPEADDLTWCIGPPLLDSFNAILGDDALAEAALNHYRARFSEVGLFENRLYAGVAESLQRLSRRNIPLFVATSKPQVYAERIVEHFGLATFFERVFGPSLQGDRNRKTDLLRWALDETGVTADATVMVGDRKHDMVGAMDNGMCAVGVLYGYGSREELEDAGAQLLLRSPDELGGILDAWVS